MTITPRFSSLLTLTAVTLASCGGGGGGSTTQARLEGTLTVPSLSSGSPIVLRDHGLNDVAHHAQRAGKLAKGAALTIEGDLAPGDARDVFQIEVEAGLQFELGHSEGIAGEVFDAMTGEFVAALPCVLLSKVATTLDVVVVSQRATAYRIDARENLGQRVDATLPRGPLSAPAESRLQVGYLGADHEMLAGEVIVTIDEQAVGVASLNTTAIGLVPAPTVHGPIQKFRVANPLPSLTAGATPTRSLELQTALAAHRASKLPGITAASPNYLYRAFQNTPNDALLARQWHFGHMKVQQAWALFSGTPGSTNVIVAVVDTGIVLSHPDFAGRLIGGYDMISDAARALDGNGIDNNPDDPGDNFGLGLPSSYHGTHVGGTIGAATNNSIGVAGVDWNCKLMPMRCLGRGGSGSLEDIAQAIRYAAGLSNASNSTPPQRCDVMNMSLGGPGTSSVLENACNAAHNAGCLLVVAAGNDNSSTPNFPASYDVCLSVGSIRYDYARAPYSNFASTVDVNAPGGDTSVDQNNDSDPDGVLSCLAAEQNGSRVVGFGFLQGTSMACPHVAGVAALVKATQSTATNTQLRNFITSSTFSRGGSNNIVDAFAAVQAAGAAATTPILTLSNTNIGIRGTDTTGTVTMSNTGAASLLTVVQPTSGGGDITYTNGSNWITSVALEGGAGTNISATTLRVNVDRTGLADGQYAAIVRVRSSTPNVAPAQLSVTLFVGTTSTPNDEIFVLLVNPDTYATAAQAQTNATATYAYAFDAIPNGRYLLVAGTDRDNDDFIGDEGELFGIWPANDTPLVLEIVNGQTLIRGLNFSLQLQAVQQSHGAVRRLPPLRIQR